MIYFGESFRFLLIFGISLLLPIPALPHRLNIFCYVGTYASTRNGRGAYHLSNLKADLCTHVIFGHIHFKQDATLYVLDSWKTFMNGTKNMTTLKRKYKNVKFMIGLGGWYDGTVTFSTQSPNSDFRRNLSRNVVQFLKDGDFDGVDLCWLYPGKRSGDSYDRTSYVALLKELKTQFQPFNYTLSALLSGDYDTIDIGYNVPEISKNVDFMNMITYDYSGFWSYSIQPNAPLYSSDNFNVDYAIKYMIKLGADRRKLMLGIPLSGRIFISTNPDQNATLKFGNNFNSSLEVRENFTGPYTNDFEGLYSYGEICLDMLKHGKWLQAWDNKSKTPFLTSTDKLMTYDNEASIKYKVRYAIDNNLGGVTATYLDFDDFLGDCSQGLNTYPLLRSIRKDIDEYIKVEKSTVTMSTNGFQQTYVSYILLICNIVVSTVLA